MSQKKRAIEGWTEAKRRFKSIRMRQMPREMKRNQNMTEFNPNTTQLQSKGTATSFILAYDTKNRSKRC